MRWFLLAVLTCSIVSVDLRADDGNRSVRSPEDYITHMKAHRRRLLALSDLLLERFQSEFPELSSPIVKDWLALHDQSKVNQSPEFLAHFHQERKEDQVAYRLYTLIYGKSVSELPESEKKEALALIQELNEMDHQIGERFAVVKHLVDALGNETPAFRQLQRLEKIVDILDRELDPIAREELGRTPWPAEQAFPNDERAHVMLSFLRENYSSVTKGLSYQDIKSKEAGSPTSTLDRAAARFCAVLMTQFPDLFRNEQPTIP